MEQDLKGQVGGSAADIYETFFVPALFEEWAPRVAEAAAISRGNHVLDVACGTGLVAREAERRIGPQGRVVGLDRNPGMLAVARRMAPRIDYREGLAEDLPFQAAAFDAVTCQFGLMFFEDRVAALREMWRVLRPDGRLAIAVWDRLEHSPGYASVVKLLQRLFGDRIADEMRAPFRLGDLDALKALAAEAGLSHPRIATVTGAAHFPSIEAWVRTDVKGWTLAELIDDRQYDLLLREARRELAPYARPDGTVAFASPAHILVATKA